MVARFAYNERAKGSIPLLLNMHRFLFLIFIKTVLLILPILLIVAFFTLIERRLMALIQRRKGPNVVGYLGLFQAITDGFKLILKEIIFPLNSNTYIFFIGPFITFFYLC